MNIEELKKLSPEDAMAKAGEYAGVQGSVFDGLWRTESGRGKNMVSPAGAEGHFQIMPKTRVALESALGQKLNPFDFHEGLLLAAEHLRGDVKREGGNVANALRAYNNGPNWRNQKDPRGENAAYAAKVLGDDSEPASDREDASAAPLPGLSDRMNTPAQARVNKYVKPAAGSVAPVLLDARLPSNGPDAAAIVGAGETASGTEQRARDDLTMVGAAQVLFMHQGVTGAILERVARENYPKEEGFVVPESDLKEQGYTESELQFVREATSRKQLDRFKWEIENERADMQTASRQGPLFAFAAGMLAGFPEGAVTGMVASMGMARTAYSAARFANQGRVGAAIAARAGEDIGSNLLMTGVEDAMTRRGSVQDYALGAAIPLPFLAMQIPGLRKQAINAMHAKVQAQVLEQHFAKQEELRGIATKNLGEDASPEAIAAEMTRVESQQIQQEQRTHTAPIDPERRMNTDVEKLMEDEKLAAGPQGDRATSDATGMVSNMSTNAEGEGKSVLTTKPLDATRNWINGEDSARFWTADRFDNPITWKDTGETSTPRERVQRDYGLDIGNVQALSTGVHNLGGMSPALVKVASWVHKTFLNDQKIVLAASDKLKLGTLGDAWNVGPNTTLIRVGNHSGATGTMLHELGHVIFTTQARRISESKLKGFTEWHAEWQRHYSGETSPKGSKAAEPALNTALERGTTGTHYTTASDRPSPPGFIASMLDIMAGVVSRNGELAKTHEQSLKYAKEYIPNIDEFGAEQFTKHIEAATADVLGWKPASIPDEIKSFMKDMWERVLKLFNYAKANDLLAPDARAVDFFEAIRKANKASATKERIATQSVATADAPAPNTPNASAALAPPVSPLNDPIVAKYGLQYLPITSPLERAEARAMVELYRRADNPKAPWNNIDKKFISSWGENQLFDNVKSTSLRMLQSENPVVRMAAHELLESPTGATGRHSTASIAKHLLEQQFKANVINEYEGAYTKWRNANGGNIAEDYLKQKKRDSFNRLVSEEIEARRQPKNYVASAPTVVEAADSLEAAYTRMLVSQKDTKTIGWASLPENSVGYMPHRMSAVAVRNMSPAQSAALYSSLVDQFVNIEGWDLAFADKLSAKYIDRVRQRALGGYNPQTGVSQTGAADIVEDALKQMGMSEAEITAKMQQYMRGGAGHTKRRIQLNLLQEFDDGNGGKFRLLDMFETDQLNLLTQQAQRVSGEVALARHGVMGRPGLMLIKRAMQFGENGSKAQPAEVEAFEQVAAEFLGDPFGNYGGKWMHRAMQVTSLARLGGIVWNQIAESINVGVGLGAGHAFQGIADMPRLITEMRALAKGGKVDGVLGGIERYYGVDFGTERYKMVFPFDTQTGEYRTIGKDSLGVADRLLRGGLHAQAKLSMWRAVSGAQERGAAEQIVHRAVAYIKSGEESLALNDMGINAKLAERLRADLPNMAVYDAAGKLSQFDITKATDVSAAEDFVQAVHRGSKQLIQGTYIGETGKWAHDGWLRLMTQFKTFSLTSVEKQWGRQQANLGTAKAIGILMGSMAVAAPIYMARVSVQAVGRDDKEAFLEKKMQWHNIARATLNYVAMSGLAGEFLDAMTAVSGVGQTTGGRAGAETGFVGTVVAPAAGLTDDVWKSIQNTKDGTNVHKVIKNMPFSNLPYLQPAISALN